MSDQARPSNPTRRIDPIMEDTQLKTRSESQQTDTPVQGSKSKSSFNNAEYERWSEKLRSRNGSKNK
jgi:hypothetical protein